MVEKRPIYVDELHYSDLRPYRIPLLQRLADSGRLAVTVWHGEPASGVGAPSTLPPLPVPEKRVKNLFWPGRSRRVIWQRGALGILMSPSDVVVCSEVIHSLTVWLLALTHRMYGKALVLHGYFYRPDKTHSLRWWKSLARRLMHRFADAYIAYGERGRAELIAEGRGLDRIFVSQNTLDTEHLIEVARHVTDDALASLRHEMGLRSEPVLLYVGRLVPEKRVDLAIRAMDLIDRSACLVIVGDGFQRNQLEAMARGRRVHFRGAIYDESELAPYFKLATLLVLPGRVGLNCVHGFANGVPCLTTSEAVVEQSPEYEYLEHDYNSLILPSDDPVLFARTVEELLADQGRLHNLRLGAVETAERLQMGRMVEQYEKAVLKAAGAS